MFRFLFLLLSYVNCHLVPMGNYVLSESSIFAKQRYVFSDSTDTALRNASISFELGLTPMNYENVTLKAHIILATSQ